MAFRSTLLGSGLAAALMLGLAGPGLAQQTPSASGAGTPQAASPGVEPSQAQLQAVTQAETALRNAMGAMQEQGSGPARQNALVALNRLRQNLDQLPQARRDGEGWRNLDTQITEAQRSLSGSQVDPGQARTEIEQVLAAVARYRGEAQGGSGANTGQAAPAGSGGTR
jgi:hypothetical protein